MRLKLILLVAALSYLPSQGRAEFYLDRGIRIIGAGGAADIVSRLIAEKMQKSLQQTVIVEDKPGANGNIGASYVLAAPADGYTVMVGHIGLMTVNTHLYSTMKLKPLTEFEPVARATTYPNLLIVNNKLPAHSTAEPVAYAKKNPKALNYLSSGFGSSFHMGFEMLKADTGINAMHIPYTGTAHALSAIIARDMQTTFPDVITVSPQIEVKALRGIAISSKTRAKNLPNIPAIAESGVPSLEDFNVIGWNGVVVKAGTPPERIKILNEPIRRALESPDIVERIAKLGAEVATGAPEEFGEFMQAEDKKWGSLVEKPT